MSKKRIALFISGRGSNMEAILRNCADGVLKECCDPALVLSNNPEAAGLKTAAAFGVPATVVLSKGKTREAFALEVIPVLADSHIDYIVLAGFNRILSPVLVEKFRNRIINIHPADTRQYQGLHGYAWAYEQQLTSTKITVHFVDEGVDTGDIILQGTVNLEGVRSLEEVVERGLAKEHELYSLALHKVFSEGS